MATLDTVRCEECGWRGPQTDTDDAHGSPACPECGAEVLLES